MKSNLYEIGFSGVCLGGKALVKAVSKEAAHKALKKKWINLEDIDKCRIKEIQDRDGILYFDNGDY